MIIKASGRTTLNASGTVNYLGTTEDETQAHQNPGLRKYQQAQQKYQQAGLSKYRQLMKKYKIYTKRDMLTFGNFDTSSTRAIKAQIRKFMSHNKRKVQTREFVIMPSDTDNVEPNDSASVYRFAHFVHSFINRHFQGRFHYYVVIQPDSRHHSRVHAHCVAVNDDLISHRAMAGRFYHIMGKNGLRADLKRTAYDYGYSVPEPTMQAHKPTRAEDKIISLANKAFQTLNNEAVARRITSQAKFAHFMRNYGIKANYRNTVRHYRKRKYRVRGWKFKLLDGKRHAYIKASRLSHADGGENLATSAIARRLSRDRQLNAKLKREAEDTKQINSLIPSDNQAPVIVRARSVTASSSASSASNSQSSIVSSSSAKMPSEAKNQTIYDRSAVQREQDEVEADMPKLSNAGARRYAYWSLKHAIPAYVIGYDGKIPCFGITRNDRSLIKKMQGNLVSGLRHLKRSALSAWHKGLATADRFLPVKNLSIVSMASIDLQPTSLAEKFHRDWRTIKDTFNDDIVQPIISHLAPSSGFSSNASASSASASASSDSSNARASSANAQTAKNNVRNDSEAKQSEALALVRRGRAKAHKHIKHADSVVNKAKSNAKGVSHEAQQVGNRGYKKLIQRGKPTRGGRERTWS